MLLSLRVPVTKNGKASLEKVSVSYLLLSKEKVVYLLAEFTIKHERKKEEKKKGVATLQFLWGKERVADMWTR